MSHQIEFTASYSLPAETVHSTLTTERFWTSRVEKAADSGVNLDHLIAGPGTIDVAISQKIDTDALPGLISKVIRGDVVLVRTDVWGPFDGNRAEATFSAVTTGLPIDARGTAVLTVNPDGGADMTVTGEVTVNVKLIGGKIEGMVAEVIVDILKRDQQAIEEWALAQA